MKPELTPKPEIGNFTVEWSDKNGFLLSRRNRLYETQSLDQKPKLIGKFSASKAQEMMAQNRVIQRAFRFLYYNVLRLSPERIFVTFQKNVGLFENGQFRPVMGLRRPSRFLRGGCAVDENGGVYLGEYLPNPNRQEIYVYYLALGSHHLEVVHTFKPGEIRHIHGTYFDPTDKSIWTLTGDSPSECRFLKTTDRFKTIVTIGQGNETWRAVSLIFRDDAIYYATDAEFQQNFVFKLNRKSLERETLIEVDGPVYYSKSTKDHMFFGVTAENCPSQKNNSAYLWAIDKQDRPKLLADFRKDVFPNHLMPGTIHFALGNMDDKVWFNCVGLSGRDNKTIEISG